MASHKPLRRRLKTDDLSERRRRIRFRVTLPIRVKSSSSEIQGQTRNVSLLGASAIATQTMPQGTPVTAEIDLPSNVPPIVMEGTIVRCIPLNLPGASQYEVGVFAARFLNQDEERLSQYLEQLQMAEYAAIRAGYKALREKIKARQAKKRAILLARKRRKAKRLARLKKRKKELAKKKLRKRK